MVANVFGTLRHLRSSLWLRPMLGRAFRTKQFLSCSMRGLGFDFWQPVPPPSVRANIEGNSEVDLLVRFGDVAIFVEAKLNAGLSTRTTMDPKRDQLARLLDVAWNFAVAEQLLPMKSPFVLVVGVPADEPELVTRYRNADRVGEALQHHRRYPDFHRMIASSASRVGYLSWSALATILAEHRDNASRAEQPFLDEVRTYIRHKVDVALRARRAQTKLLFEFDDPQLVAKQDDGEVG